MNTFLKKHALPVYFGLAFGISWAGILLAAGTGRFAGQMITMEQFTWMVPAMFLGPFISSLLLIFLTGGRRGLSDLAGRQRHWRVGSWYGALLLNPLLTLAVLAGFAWLVSPAFRPVFNPLGILVGLLAGGFEEAGWTGFATPRLLEKYTPLKAALILGVLHGGWHLLANFIGSTPGQESLWVVETLVFWIGGLTAYRVLMTWVYVHTRSLLLGQLMHVVFTGSFFMLIPALAYPQTVAVYAAITAGLWVLAGMVIARYGSSLAGRAAQARAAQA